MSELQLASEIDPAVFEQAQAELIPRMRQVDGFGGAHIVRVGDDRVVLVIIADSPETLDRIATETGNDWMREHVLPHLAGPPNRQVGTVVASSLS